MIRSSSRHLWITLSGGGMKFDYTVHIGESDLTVAKGYTRHACVNKEGKVVRPPFFLRELINRCLALPGDAI